MGVRRPPNSATGESPTSTASVADSPSVAPGATELAFPTSSHQPTGSYHLVQIPLPPAVSDDADSLLAVARNGAAWAYRDSARKPGPIHLVHRDGDTVDIDLTPGLELAPQAAEFSPDGSWLAATDGAGSLWRIDVTTGKGTLLSTGAEQLVFGLGLAFQSPDRLLVNMVGAVPIPMPSRIARVALDGGVAVRIDMLTTDPSAYYPLPLSDGRIAYIHQNFDGTRAVRAINLAGVEEPLAELGEAGWTDVSPDGTSIVYEINGVSYKLDVATGAAQTVGPGSRPRISPDGAMIAVLDLAQGQTAILSLSGTSLGSAASITTAWVQCDEGC